MFCGLEVKGRERIPKKGGFILAGNHVSYLDPIILGVASPRKLNFMAKEELFRNKLFSWVLYHVCAFPVKRKSTDLSAVKEAVRRLKKGGALLLFPEGTRATDSAMGEAQPGIGFFATKVGVPVIPAFVRGSGSVWPKGSKVIRPQRISVYFGQEISIERGMPYQNIAEEIIRSIRHLAC